MLGLDPAGEKPEGVGKAIKVDEDFGVLELLHFVERCATALGATTGGAGDIKGGGVHGGTGGGPAFEGNILRLDLADEGVELAGERGVTSVKPPFT